MRLTNFFQSFNKGVLMTAVLSSSFLARSHVPKIPKKTVPLLTNDHRSFHSSAPLFKKKKQKPPRLVEDKKFQELTKQTKKEFKKNKPKITLTSITIKKLETKNLEPYYLIVNNNNQDDAYFCFEGAVQSGWNYLVSSYKYIRKVKIKFEEVTKTVDLVDQEVVNFKIYKKVVSLTKIKPIFVEKFEKQKSQRSSYKEKFEKQKSQKMSYKEKIFSKMCEEEASRNND